MSLTEEDYVNGFAELFRKADELRKKGILSDVQFFGLASVLGMCTGGYEHGVPGTAPPGGSPATCTSKQCVKVADHKGPHECFWGHSFYNPHG